MCDKAVDNYPHALEFVPEFYKLEKMCDKAVDTHPSTIEFVPECYKTQKAKEIKIKLNFKLNIVPMKVFLA